MFQQELMDTVSAALEAEPRTDKELARAIDCVPRTVRSWREKLSLPNLPLFIRLCMEIPELRQHALQWLSAEAKFDPTTERMTLDLLRQMQDHLERRQARIEREGPPA